MPACLSRISDTVCAPAFACAMIGEKGVVRVSIVGHQLIAERAFHLPAGSLTNTLSARRFGTILLSTIS